MQNEPVQVETSLFNFINLALLPAMSGVRICYFYAAVPLHYLESGWALTAFGITVAASTVGRSFVYTPLYGQLGPWIVLPATMLHLGLSIPQVILPDNFLAVTLGILGASLCYFLDVYQSLTFSRFEDSQLRSRASRICTLGDTIGFGTSPFIGGLLFDFGGWQMCAIFQLALCSAELVLVWTNPLVRSDFKRWHLARREHISQEVTVTVNGHDSSSQRPMRCCSGRRRPSNEEAPVSSLPPSIRLPGILIAMVCGLNMFVYVVEWSLFAVYFRQEFNWNSAWWAGAAQMSGDVTGAIILTVVSGLKKKKSGQDSPASCCLLRLFRAPYHISLLLLSWSVCHFLIASPIFAVAVAAQIMMGTVFVFNCQFLVEMMQLYAGTNLKLYLRLQCMGATCFGAGVAIGTFASTWAYVTLGRKLPFLAASAIALAGCLVYTFCFCTRVGLPRSLKEFEEEHSGLPQEYHSKVKPQPEASESPLDLEKIQGS